MSLYRQQGGRGARWIVTAALVALVAGATIGYAVGRSSAPEPTLSDRVAEVQNEVAPVIDGISLVPDHYEQSVRGGEVVEPVQYEGATQQVAAAQDALTGAAGDLEVLDAAAYSAAAAKLEELKRAVAAKDDPAAVARLADESRAAVAAAAGESDGG
jgi:hypothetical protein